MTIYDLLCCLKDFTNIADFMKLKEIYFTKLLNLESGTPLHYCLYDDETIVTEIYYIIDYQISIEKLIETIRERWNIECGLH